MTNIPEKKISDGISLILDTMQDTLSSGRRIEIRGFGSFSLHYRKSRKAHNPKTQEKLHTTAKYSPHFKPGKDLKDRVNNSKDSVAICEDE